MKIKCNKQIWHHCTAASPASSTVSSFSKNFHSYDATAMAFRARRVLTRQPQRVTSWSPGRLTGWILLSWQQQQPHSQSRSSMDHGHDDTSRLGLAGDLTLWSCAAHVQFRGSSTDDGFEIRRARQKKTRTLGARRRWRRSRWRLIVWIWHE